MSISREEVDARKTSMVAEEAERDLEARFRIGEGRRPGYRLWPNVVLAEFKTCVKDITRIRGKREVSQRRRA